MLISIKQVFKVSFKKASILGLVAICTVGLFQSCTKDSNEASQLAGGGATGGTPGLVSSCGEALKAGNVLGLVSDQEDGMNHRVNMILYHYGQALKTVVQNPSLLCYVESSISEDATRNGVSLYTMAQTNPAFAAALNTALRQSINENDIYPRGEETNIEQQISTPGFDVNGFLKSRLTYPPYNYHPIIYSIPGIESCAPARTPYILIEQDVDDCDDVAGWHGADEVVMGEKDVMTASDPVIFVGPGLSTYTLNGMAYGDLNQVIFPASEYETAAETNSIPSQAAADRADVDIDADLHQIKAGYRYDSSNRSEIGGIVEEFELFHPNNIYTYFWDDFNRGQREIHKNDINNSTTFTDDRGAFKILSSLYDTNVSSIFFVTYEYDWYANNKDVVNPCNQNSNYTMVARMKYSHEWYLVKCGYGSLLFPSVGSTKDYNETKCHFTLKRTI